MRQKNGYSLVGGQLCQIFVLCSPELVRVPVTVNPTRGLSRSSESVERFCRGGGQGGGFLGVGSPLSCERSIRLIVKYCRCLYRQVEKFSAVPCWPARFSRSTLSLLARTLGEGLVPVWGDAQPFLSLLQFPPLPLLSSSWLFLTMGGLGVGVKSRLFSRFCNQGRQV